MDIKIDARNSTSQLKVQHLPFNIKYDGPARLASYFVAKKTTQLYEGKHVLQAGFRGRLLTGLPVTLPADYTGCIFRDSDQLAYKGSAVPSEECEELPDPHNSDVSVREWRLLGTFRTLVSWQRRTDNQLDADQFLDEQSAASAPVVSIDDSAPPAPPAPNMTTLSHKTALFNWMRWIDVGQTIHAPITAAQIARVQEQDLLAATEAQQQEATRLDQEVVEPVTDTTTTTTTTSAEVHNAESTSVSPSTRKRKHAAVESEEETSNNNNNDTTTSPSPATKKQRNT